MDERREALRQDLLIFDTKLRSALFRVAHPFRAKLKWINYWLPCPARINQWNLVFGDFDRYFLLILAVFWQILAHFAGLWPILTDIFWFLANFLGKEKIITYKIRSRSRVKRRRRASTSKSRWFRRKTSELLRRLGAAEEKEAKAGNSAGSWGAAQGVQPQLSFLTGF